MAYQGTDSPFPGERASKFLYEIWGALNPQKKNLADTLHLQTLDIEEILEAIAAKSKEILHFVQQSVHTRHSSPNFSTILHQMLFKYFL